MRWNVPFCGTRLQNNEHSARSTHISRDRICVSESAFMVGVTRRKLDCLLKFRNRIRVHTPIFISTSEAEVSTREVGVNLDNFFQCFHGLSVPSCQKQRPSCIGVNAHGERVVFLRQFCFADCLGEASHGCEGSTVPRVPYRIIGVLVEGLPEFALDGYPIPVIVKSDETQSFMCFA